MWGFHQDARLRLTQKFPTLACRNTDFFGIVFFGIFEVPQRAMGQNFLEKTLRSKGNAALIELIKSKRKEARLTQAQVAKAFGQRQTWYSHLESGERRIDVIEYVRLAELIGFDPAEELRNLIPVILSKELGSKPRR